MNFLSEHYNCWLSLHIIFTVSWFAALFYLPRFFVYHTQAIEGNNKEAMQYFKTMERKLYFIGHIAMGFSITFGIILIVSNNFLFLRSGESWLYVKLALVLLLVIYFCYCGRITKNFAKDINHYSETFYRWFNEIPSVLLIVIVFLVVFKAF